MALAFLGLLFAGMFRAIPWVLWRYHVAQALETARSAGPEFSWPFDACAPTPRADEFLYLLSDRERVLGELLRSMEHDPNDIRRVHAIQTMRALLRQSYPWALRKRCLDQALDLATRARLSPAVEKELAGAVADWVSTTGLDARQRGTILARAKDSSGDLLPAWVHVLAEVGGREEVLFLISLGNVHDPALLDAVHNSPLIGCRWPGLLPALKSWLDDPTAALWALRYSLLSQTPEGRDLLIAYATNAAQPVELRRSAIERLQETVPGINLLIRAAEKPDALAVLGASIQGNPQTTFRAALTKLKERNGQFLWSELIKGLDPEFPNRFSNPTTALEKAASEAEAHIRQDTRESSLHCLQWITGNTGLRSRAEWQRWYGTRRPSSLSQSELVKLVLDHPEALDSAAILRRIVPYHLGSVSEECVPLYERMAREGPPAARYWACTALLLGTPGTDVVPIVIDLIGPRPTGDVGAASWGADRSAQAALRRELLLGHDSLAGMVGRSRLTNYSSLP
ncbi:MAG: hypothetical protein ACP5XB_03735 [Isosphaeraceae bacterium]